MPRRYKIFAVVAAVIFIADQLTKLWARGLPTDARGYGIAQPVIENFFDWRISYNTGSAFGLFNDVGGARIFLTVIGFVAIGAIVGAPFLLATIAMMLVGLSALAWVLEGGAFASVAYALTIDAGTFGPWFSLATGTLAMILFQLVVNVGMNLGLLPVAGLPLPFISYGPAALLTTMIGIGIAENVAMRHRKLEFTSG